MLAAADEGAEGVVDAGALEGAVPSDAVLDDAAGVNDSTADVAVRLAGALAADDVLLAVGDCAAGESQLATSRQIVSGRTVQAPASSLRPLVTSQR